MDNAKKTKLWAIPRSLIAELGAGDAYLLVKLCHLQRAAKTTVAGKKWFYCPQWRNSKQGKGKTYRPISDGLPWLRNRFTIREAIRRLEAEKKLLVRAGLNASTYDRTLWYHVPDSACKAGLSKRDLRWFNPDEAVAVGINAALVLNVIYKEFALGINPTEEDVRLVLSRRAIALDVGLPATTVNDVFKKLIEAGYLSSLDGRAFKLLVKNPCKMKGRGTGRHKVAKMEYVKELSQNDYAAVVEQLVQQNAQVRAVAGEVQTGLHQLVEMTY